MKDTIMTGKILKTAMLRGLGAVALAVALVGGFRATAGAGHKPGFEFGNTAK